MASVSTLQGGRQLVKRRHSVLLLTLVSPEHQCIDSAGQHTLEAAL